MQQQRKSASRKFAGPSNPWRPGSLVKSLQNRLVPPPLRPLWAGLSWIILSSAGFHRNVNLLLFPAQHSNLKPPAQSPL